MIEQILFQVTSLSVGADRVRLRAEEAASFPHRQNGQSNASATCDAG
jgi:hypothetical protein